MQQANECENNLMQQLHTLTSCTWQQQVDIIKGLKITPQLIKLISCRNYSSEMAGLFAAHNPRTKLITALADFLVELFSTSANQIVPFANLLITNECLIRLLASGNKVVSSSGNEIMKSIIGHLDFRNKAKHIKFVPTLEQEILTSKNSYVREKISLYFLLISTSYYYSTHEALSEFERKVVKEGLQDASEKVRANMKQILENIHHFEKENNIAEMQKGLNIKSTEKVSMKNTKITKTTNKNKSLRVLNNSSINQSSIIENFVQQEKEKVGKGGIREQSFGFYLQRLKSGNSWSMVHIAYESLQDLIEKGYLQEQNSDELYCETIQALTPLLNQKRGKINQSSARMFNQILEIIIKGKRTNVIAFCQQNAVSMIEHVIKNQCVAALLLPTLISLNPSFFIAKISQISVNAKITRQKLLLLDSIVTNLQRIMEESLPSKSNKKVSTMVKAMCQHIQHSTIKQKEVSLAALAIISQLKSKYPDQVLTALLCQSDKSLSKILQLAESIDPSLKTAIIDYINSLKASSKKSIAPNSKQPILSKKPIGELLQAQMLLVSQQGVSNLNRLGELALTHSAELDCKQFKRLLCLLEFLCNSDLIMEYKILMEQLAAISGNEFLLALVQILTSACHGEEAKAREFHDLLLLELLQLRIAKAGKYDDSDMDRIVKCIIEVYRNSESIKKRNMTIELLTKINASHLEQWLNQDEVLLVQTYKSSLEEQNEMFTI